MEAMASPLPFYAVLVPLAASALIRLSARSPNVREAWTMLASLTMFAVVASMLPGVLEGKSYEFIAASIAPGLEISFRADALGMFFALTASFLWIITSVYSIGYVRSLEEHAQTRYFSFFAVALSAAMGVAFSANLLTMFVFYEVLTLSTFPLVAHKETPEAMAGARRYLTYLLGTSLSFLLMAVILTYWKTGTLDFSPGGILRGEASGAFVAALFVLFVAGTAKAALMPLHSWLPAAMVAPTPVSALLHAVAVVKAGVFVVIRLVLYVFGVDLLAEIGLGAALAWFASFTIIAASVIALKQDNLKLRLAYSTISQLSYIVLGVALLSPSGVTGSVVHIAMHAFSKITLFFVAGAIYVAAHKTNISELDGIGRRMPLTMGAFALGSISMIGMPPLAGFVSKWHLALGSVEAGMLPVLAVLAASTVLNACYFMPIVYRAFFREGDGGEVKEAPALMLVPLVLTAIGAVVLFFRPGELLELAEMVVSQSVGGGLPR
ncbi:MAG: monovalent cation/H+ antiporter subunit D family protein [Nitrospirota bacterium]|jgi:multicomponent Na+:H+ antiporter subunit D